MSERTTAGPGSAAPGAATQDATIRPFQVSIPEEQLAELRRRIEAMQQLMPHLAGLDASGVRDALRKEEWLIGTPEQIIAALQALADEGVERVMLQHNDQTDFEALELIAREVMPAIAR